MRNGGIERLVSLSGCCRLIVITAFRVKEALSKSITTVIDFSVRAARDATPRQTNQTGNGLVNSALIGSGGRRNGLPQSKQKSPQLWTNSHMKRSRFSRGIFSLKKGVVTLLSLIRHKVIDICTEGQGDRGAVSWDCSPNLPNPTASPKPQEY